MPKLRYSEPALEDLKEIQRYIARDKREAARKWVAKIRWKCRIIAKNPERSDLRVEFGHGIRSSYLGNYEIFFREVGDVVEIVRVMRGGRDIRFL